MISIPDTIIGIKLERYNELLKKEFAYDMYRRELLKDKYASDTEKTLFDIPGKEGEE